jgi:hypothetical protein
VIQNRLDLCFGSASMKRNLFKKYSQMSKSVLPQLHQAHLISLRVLSLLAIVGLLVSCGGGGGNTSANVATANNVIAAEANANVVVVTENQLGAIAGLEKTTAGLKFTSQSLSEIDAKVGQVVSLSPSEALGLPFGFTGRVINKTITGGLANFELVPATLTEVYKTLDLNFDSARDGLQIVGMVGPTGKAVVNRNQPLKTKSFLSGIGLELGAEINPEGAKLDLEIPFEKSLGDEDAEDAPKLYLTFGATDVLVKSEIKVEQIRSDPCSFPGCVDTVTSKVTKNIASISGTVGAKIGVKWNKEILDLKTTKDYRLLSKVIRGNNAIKWNELDRKFLGFEVSGLDGKDKEGLIPLGGVVVVPGVLAKTFTGDNIPAGKVLKNFSVILWFYVALDGTVKVTGDFSLFKFEAPIDGTFGITDYAGSGEADDAPGFNFKPVSLKSEFNGAIDATFKVGLSAAIDVFIGGIRPLTVKADAFSADLRGNVTADSATIQIYPMPESSESPLSGTLCTDASYSVTSGSIAVLAQVEAGKKFKSNKWKKLSQSSTIEASFTYEAPGYDWLQQAYVPEGGTPTRLPILGLSKCWSSDAFLITPEIIGISEKDPLKRKVRFIVTGGSKFLKGGVKRLDVQDQWAEGSETFSLVNTSDSSYFETDVYAGSAHNFAFKPFHEFYGEVKANSSATLRVPSNFSVSVTAKSAGSRCEAVQLLSQLGAPVETRSPITYSWWITQNNTPVLPLIETASSSVSFDLPGCTLTSASLIATGADGSQALYKFTFDPNNLKTSVTKIEPGDAIIGEARTFTIIGSSLPSTAVLSISGGGSCATVTVPNADPSTGFKQTCTPSGSAGTRSVSVLTQAGGVAIGAPQTISVRAAAPVCIAPQTLQSGICVDVGTNWTFSDYFDGVTSVDSTKWTVDGFNPNQIGPVSVSGGFAQFGAFGRISTAGKVNFSGSKIVIEARMAGTGGGRDTSILLKDVSNTNNVIYSGDTNYCGWGFFVSAGGVFEITSGALECGGSNKVRHLGASTNQFMEYRWTIQGTQMTIERGATLASITESITVTLGQTIEGRTFNLSIGTAANAYSPGTWDWVRVSTTQTPGAAATSNLITFEELPNQMTAMVNNGSAIPINSRLSNQYLATHGVAFTSTGGFAALVNHGAPTASNPNIIGGSTAAGQLSFLEPIMISFFNVADLSVKAVTNRFKIQGDWTPLRSGQVFATAFDISGNVIGTTSDKDNKIFGVSGPILEFNVAGIHRVVIRGDSGTVGFDQLEFGVLLVAP